MTDRPAPPTTYGKVPAIKILEAFNRMRQAIRSGDLEAAEEALDVYEQWADYLFGMLPLTNIGPTQEDRPDALAR